MCKDSYNYLHMRAHGETSIGALDYPARRKWELLTGKKINRSKMWLVNPK